MFRYSQSVVLYLIDCTKERYIALYYKLKTMKIKIIVGLVFCSLLFLSSCSTTKKCDGSKGIKTNMGTM